MSNGEETPSPPLRANLDDRLLTYTGLQNLPDPEPLIDNVLDKGTVALLYGYWGSMKTFIALDWAASVATGRAWQGRPSKRCKVLYIAAEGAFGYKARLTAWTTAWNIPLSDDDIHILPIAVNLTNTGEVAALCALVEHRGYGLVVIDTLARCMVGADENSAKDCGMVVAALSQLRDATPEQRGVILGVHHSGKDGVTLRGSSAFEGAADTAYFTNRDGPATTLERMKRRDGPTGDHHELKLDLVEGTGSGVIAAWAANRLSNLSKHGEPSGHSANLMSKFVQHFVQTGATRAELRRVADMPPSTFHRALNDLLEHGDIVNLGTDKSPFYQEASK